MLKNTACTITYVCWNSGTGGVMTGDVTNHTVTWSKDGGTPATCTNSPAEIGGGVYKVALTATEANCDLGTLIVSSSTSAAVVPPLQFVFHDASLYKADVSGIPSSVWSNSTRTLTSSSGGGATAAEVWSYSGGRTLTSSPTDISGLATASNLSTLQTTANGIKAKTDNLPSSPAAVGSAMTLTSAYDAAKTAAPTASANASAVWGASTRTLTASPTDVSGLATSSALSSVANDVSAVKAKTDNLPASPAATGDAMTLTSAYDAAKSAASATSVSALSTMLTKLLAVGSYFSISGNVLTAYNADGTQNAKYDLTKDNDGNITAITPQS